MHEKQPKIRLIAQERIFSSHHQPRKLFDENALDELAKSIDAMGLLQPITVRKIGGRFEIVAGERRYRACLRAGLEEIPCIVVEADHRRAELLALTENLQRRDLDCFEVAAGLGRMIEEYSLTQEECARYLGKSQSAIANKLRLLKLDKKIVAEIRRHGLTERHARALLKLSTVAEMKYAISRMASEGMSVSQAEALVEAMGEAIKRQHATPAERHRVYVVKDIRLFFNSVTKAVDTMRLAGIPAEVERSEEPDNLVLTVRIPKKVRGEAI
ncbi:MAG: ParB/RepB/Spo0J family partition protein [Clostridia bacterium]|nr:ParB/RepB/Spo0J family partition protein [Oscillospiraceae bacterium]MBQ2748349.1 ParB/RepB/Spo0J family partition protein [Clostridia bacterium]MBQ4623797.1 ParB/RepB/Spo0J family partition protein [Clostridia bacterium]MBQ6990243.1 ParB/RepB/Spo0J family partition protein [Clostridia bacterium]MBR6763313.1 ParB/RepB/Spo0J family partition protein [Clostridia bacterium]